MKTTYTLAAALAVGATGAFAGGADRSGQSVAPIFESGDYFEASFGHVMPSVSGVFTHPLAGDLASGNMASSYTQFGMALKTDLSEKFSIGLILDKPFGADVNYSQAGYPINGTTAQVATTAITVLGKYKASERISVYAGPRIVSASGHYNLVSSGAVAYSTEYSSDTDVGFVVGAAYEIPAIALRAALTYSSQTEFALAGTNADATAIVTTAGDLTAIMPQSVNLEFQTGIAANTLLMASVRWADWSEAHITDSVVLATGAIGGAPLTEFGNADTLTYTLGVGRKFSDKFSGSATIGYEKSTGDVAGNLAPTDGYWSIALGGAYNLGNGAKISGGVRYVKVGDANTLLSGITTDFTDNSAVAVGLKFSQSF